MQTCRIQDVGVFLGLDVGKSAHHGHGLTPAGKKVFDKPLPNSEPKLRAVFDKLTAHLRDEAATPGIAVRQGCVWTTDALYRESATEVQQYAAEGVVVADLEAAGVLAVARYRRVPAAATFAVADSLARRTPRGDEPQTRDALLLARRGHPRARQPAGAAAQLDRHRLSM
ncbi:IS110 family transposase [Streptomyces sp. A5-4]|uniref:phosphorylase family protein n=1 Tax=Streptomyces sp. A5-4 TaxID=3384771 RepID=UPI003DA854E9